MAVIGGSTLDAKDALIARLNAEVISQDQRSTRLELELEKIRDEYEALTKDREINYILDMKDARIAGLKNVRNVQAERIAELEAGIKSMRHSLADDECSCTTPPSERSPDEIAGGCCNDDDNPECHSDYCPVYLAHYAGRLLEQREVIS